MTKIILCLALIYNKIFATQPKEIAIVRSRIALSPLGRNGQGIPARAWVGDSTILIKHFIRISIRHGRAVLGAATRADKKDAPRWCRDWAA
jgi:hypothetical protein